MSGSVLAATAPVVRGVRMLVAPVDHASGVPLTFDPAVEGRFTDVPTGWYDLGMVGGLERTAETVFTEVASGAPAMVKTRARAKVTAGLRCTVGGWSRLAMMLSAGSSVLNLLRAGTPGMTDPAMPLLGGSTATVLQLAPGSNVQAGDIIVVDDDYTGQTGAVGAAIPGAIVTATNTVAGDAHFIRRVSFNVGRVAQVSASASAVSATLAAPLLAGVPTPTMKLAVAAGFVDRLGSTSVQEWSALLVMDGVQGDRVLVHFPRLQCAASATETLSNLAAGLHMCRLPLQMHALPVQDATYGERVLCSRSYLPAPGRLG